MIKIFWINDRRDKIEMDFNKTCFEKIKKIKPNIKDSTIKQYLLSLKKISRELFDCEKPSMNYFKDFYSIKEYLEKYKSIASRKNMVTSILVSVKAYSEMFSEDTIKLYSEYHKHLSKKQEEEYLDNAKTQRETDNWISRNDIYEKIKLLNSETKNSKTRRDLDKFQQYLVINLYTLLPPLRNDYVMVKVINDPDFENNEEKINTSYNYINLKTKNLLLCTYKTDKFYGIKKVEIPEELFQIIIDWENKKADFYKDKLTHNFLLLNTTNCTPMKHNTLTKYLNKIFYPKKVSSTLLRKIYLSEKYPVDITYREQLKDSYVMGHSIGTQKMIYSKK